jgi:hypothetical protein
MILEKIAEMANPYMAPLALVSTALSIGASVKAKRRLKRANKYQTAIDNIQNAARRAQQAQEIRMTIATQYASDIASGAGFESSRTMGQQAATITSGRRAQEGFDITQQYGVIANKARAKAGQAVSSSQAYAGAASVFDAAESVTAKYVG